MFGNSPRDCCSEGKRAGGGGPQEVKVNTSLLLRSVNAHSDMEFVGVGFYSPDFIDHNGTQCFLSCWQIFDFDGCGEHIYTLICVILFKYSRFPPGNQVFKRIFAVIVNHKRQSTNDLVRHQQEHKQSSLSAMK